MRDALSLIQRLPVMKTDLFQEDFYNVSMMDFIACKITTIFLYSSTCNLVS